MKDLKNEQYKNALDLMVFEAQMLWQIMQTFLVANTILFAIISNSFFKVGDEHNNAALVILAILGIIISIVWLGTFHRNSKYYLLRMYQAKEIEDNTYPLLNDKAEKFSLGFEVEMNNKKIGMNTLAYLLTNKRGAAIIIYTFITLYIILILTELNWICL